MNAKEMICIRCPVGCRLTVEEVGGEIRVRGHECRRGLEYGKQEYTAPMRAVTSSVRVRGGVRPLCSVKTANDVPKARIADVLDAIHKTAVDAPVDIGQIILEDAAGTGVPIVATADVALKQP